MLSGPASAAAPPARSRNSSSAEVCAPRAAISLAMLNRVASVSGCSGPSIRSRIASTARSSPSAAVCSPARRHFLGDAEPGRERVRMLRAQHPPLIAQGLAGAARRPRPSGWPPGGPPPRLARLASASALVQPLRALLIGQGPARAARRPHRSRTAGARTPRAESSANSPQVRIPVFGRLGQGAQQDVVRPPPAGPAVATSAGAAASDMCAYSTARPFVPEERRLAGQQHERRARQRVLVRRARPPAGPGSARAGSRSRRAQEVSCSGLSGRRLATGP